jgi:hypothetical protein
MKKPTKNYVVLGLLFFFFLLTSRTIAAEISIADYVLLKVGSWSRFTYISPVFPDFTIKAVTLNTGPFAGKYRVGDYQYPYPGPMTWRIMDWNDTTAFIYAADDVIFDPPLQMPIKYQTDTLIPHPFEAGIYWYFKLIPILTVKAGTFNDVLMWFDLDSQFPPNDINSQYGIPGTYGVTGVEWYGRGVADLKYMNVDAGSGSIIFDYELQSTGRIGGSVPAAVGMLLLMD